MKNLILGFSIGILVLESVSLFLSVSGKSSEGYTNIIFAKQSTYDEELEKLIYFCMELNALAEDGFMNDLDLDEETKGDCEYLLETTDTLDQKYLEKKYGSINTSRLD